MDKRGREGVSRFSVENLLYHRTEKLCTGTLMRFRKFLVSKNFMAKRGEGGREYYNFSSKIYCLTVLKKFLGEPFGDSEDFGYRKILCMRGGYHDFLSEFFRLTLPKNFVGEPFLVSEKLCYRNFSYIKGAVSWFSVVRFKFKTVGKVWDSNPYLPLQKLVFLPTVPWEQLKFLTNVSEIIKIFGTTETRARTCCLKTLLS